MTTETWSDYIFLTGHFHNSERIVINFELPHSYGNFPTNQDIIILKADLDMSIDFEHG